MYSIIDKKPTSNNVNNYPNYPDYFPDKLLVLGKSFYEKINELFSYKLVYLYPNKDNIKEIKDIIEFRICPDYKHKLYYMNCFNPLNNFKITFIRVCHSCNVIFILSGRYNTKIKYQNAFEYFKNLNKKEV